MNRRWVVILFEADGVGVIDGGGVVGGTRKFAMGLGHFSSFVNSLAVGSRVLWRAVAGLLFPLIEKLAGLARCDGTRCSERDAAQA